jgi:hypothetical protein
MEDTMTRTQLIPSLAVAAAGPLAIGAVLGLPSGLGRVVSQAAFLPAIFLGVAAVMAPALYIAVSLAGGGAGARDVAEAVLGGLRSAGLTLLGLALPAAFLTVTLGSPRGALVLGALVVAGAAFIGMRATRRTLSGDWSMSLATIFWTWGLVAAGIGGRLFIEAVA